jgi:hypothetical protein
VGHFKGEHRYRITESEEKPSDNLFYAERQIFTVWSIGKGV